MSPRLAVKTWDNMIEAEATNPELYTYFATFLVMGYTGPKNKPLAHGTVKGYPGSLMNMAKAKFGATGTDATKLFFTALDKGATTEAHEWYKKLKDRIWRICFERAKEAGTKMDSSADPLYAKDFAEMVSAAATAQTLQTQLSSACSLYTHSFYDAVSTAAKAVRKKIYTRACFYTFRYLHVSNHVSTIRFRAWR